MEHIGRHVLCLQYVFEDSSTILHPHSVGLRGKYKDYDLEPENAKNLAWSPKSGKIQNLAGVSVPPISLQDGNASLNTAKLCDALASL